MSATAPEPRKPEHEEDDRAHRNFVNLAAFAVVLLIAIAAIWVFRILDDQRKLGNCLASGRRDCVQLGAQPGSGG